MRTERTPGQRNKAAKAIAWERPGDVLRALPEHMDIWARSDQATLQHLAQAIQKAKKQRPESLLDEWPDKPWLKPALRTEGPDDPRGPARSDGLGHPSEDGPGKSDRGTIRGEEGTGG